MPTLPDRSVGYGSHDQDKRNLPERTPVKSKRERGYSGLRSSSPNATMEKTRESGRLNEGSRSNFVGQGYLVNDRAMRDDPYNRDESYARDSAGSFAKSRTHSTGISSAPTSKANEKRPSPIPKERFPSPPPRSTREGASFSASKASYGAPSTSVYRSTREGPSASIPTIPEEDYDFLASVAQTTKPRPSREDPYSSRSKTSTTANDFKEVEEAQTIELTRPAHGVLGDVVNLQTNCFKVDLDSSIQLYRYHVHVSPKPKTAREHHRAFELFLNEGSCLNDSRRAGATEVLATDHRNTVVTVKPLKLGRSDRGQCQVDYYEPEDTGPKKIPSTNTHVFTISLTKTQPLSLNKLMDYVSSTSAQASFGRIESTIQVLNIAMSQKPVSFTGVIEPSSETNVSTKWEDVPGSLGGGLVALGCHSARIINAGPSLFANINPRISSFYKAGPLVDLIRAFISSGNGPIQLHGFLKGVRVRVDHLKSESGRSRVKTITGLAHVPKLGANANEANFVWMKKEISVTDYYLQNYGIMLKSSNEPVVNVGDAKRPTFFPPELCVVLPNQRANQALCPDQAKKMNILSLQNAGKLVRSIEDKVGHTAQSLDINTGDMSGPKSFGITTQANVLRLAGRVLPAPQIQYQRMELTPEFGSWNLKADRKFKTGAGITEWAYTEIRFPNQGLPTWQVKQFIEILEKSYESTICARQHGPPTLVLSCTCPEKQFADLDKYFHQCRGKSIKTLLLFLPDNRQTLFACIKYLADVKYGIQTICIEISTLQKHIHKSWYAATIAQKLNTRGGGVNQCLPRNELRSLLSTSTMIVGIDVTNPFPKGQAHAATSIIGVVASKNAHCTQWPASVRRQDQPDKIVVDLKEMMTERLNCWRDTNGSFPANILIYRNGVTEKATAVVLNEIRAIEDAIAHVYGGRMLPKVTAITISRSHHLRFYPADEKAADGQSGNPKVGTVVDGVVTSNVPWDFYLQSHPGTPKSGTVCPAHYVVIKNDMEFTAGGVQQLTNNLCYLSARGTRAMSVVPPARYAAAVCARARCFVMACAIAGGDVKEGDGMGCEGWVGGVNEELGDSMWYV